MKTVDALRAALAEVDAYYKERGIFQDKFGFGASPALIVIDMAYGWTDGWGRGGYSATFAGGALEGHPRHLHDIALSSIPTQIGGRFLTQISPMGSTGL
jgi:hypothetical protein